MSIFWVPLDSRGPPGTPRVPSRSFQSFCTISVPSEHRPGPAPGRPQGGPECPQGTSRARFWVDLGSIFRVTWSAPGTEKSIDLSGDSADSDDSKSRDETREVLRKSFGILSEVAWKLPVIPMLHVLLCWIPPRVQDMMSKTRKTLVISGATMHEGLIYRAICTVEL